MRYKINRHIVAGLIVLCSKFLSVQRCPAQTADTLQPYRDFLSLCTAYQYPPLQLNISFQTSSNLILNPMDSLSAQGYLYMGTNGTYYLQFGDVEQYINDSISIMINHKYHQVVVNSDIIQARQLLNRYLGSITNDTSLQNLAKMFSITNNQAGTIGQYNLLSRSKLPATDKYRQSVHLKYSIADSLPVEVMTLRRTLVPVDAADSIAFVEKFAGQNVLESVPGRGLYFVRSYTSTYTYTNIRHVEPSSGVPLNIADYIIRNEEGEYVLTPGKSNYRLSIE